VPAVFGNTPPAGKGNHPVVLVTVNDAEAYALWLSRKTGRKLRLPGAEEWEKAMRGRMGVYIHGVTITMPVD